MEGFIFLEGKDYLGTMGGGSLVDKSGLEMVIKEVVENFKLRLREDTSERLAEKFLLSN